MADRPIRNPKLQTMQVYEVDKDTGEFTAARVRSPYPTPWGAAQHTYTHQRGVHYVKTGSHGGFLISKRWAEKNLSTEALEQAKLFNNYYCFEQDVLAHIVLLESSLVRSLNSKLTGKPELTQEEIISSLSLTCASYLQARGLMTQPSTAMGATA